MKKILLIVALVLALAAPAAWAAVEASGSSDGRGRSISKEDAARLEEAGKKVAELAKAGAPQEEIAAAAAEVQKIYDELRAKQDAEIAKYEKLGREGKE